jgi:chromosome segregation ATPase
MEEGFQFIMANLDKLGMGSGVISTAAYLIWKKISSDNKIDEIESKSQKVVDNVMLQLESERKENMDLRNAVERVAVERNNAVSDLGALQSEVKGLETQVNLLSTQIGKLEEENRRLTLEVRLMSQQIMTFMASIVVPQPVAEPEAPKWTPQFIGDKP